MTPGLFRQRQLVPYLLLFGLLLALVPRAGFPNDVNFWARWATYSLEHGLGNVYELPDNNYNPLYHYVLWLYGQLAGSPDRIMHYRHALKAFTLLFDFAGAIGAAALVRQKSRRFELSLLLLFNLGYLYNTLLWEQVDAMYTALAFGAVVLAMRGSVARSMGCYALALLTKTQAIIFLPPLLLLWFPLGYARPRRLAHGLGVVLGLSLLVLAPFIWGGHENFLPRILAINRNAVDFAPVVSMNCYNLWYLIFPNLADHAGPDTVRWLGLTYKQWGLLLFTGSSILVLLPLLQLTLRRLWAPAGPLARNYWPLVLLSCGLMPLLFAFFNTQMHERYWHAAVLLLAAYGFLTGRYGPYALVSGAYFLNLENMLHFFETRNYTLFFFQPRFVAGLFALTIGLAVYELYRQVFWPRRWFSGGAAPEPAT